jgi:hypothetical protein
MAAILFSNLRLLPYITLPRPKKQLISNKTNPSTMQYERIYDILKDAHHIIHPDTTDFFLDPTPIRPEGVRVVKEVVPDTESGLYKDETFYNLLSSLVRKRKSEDSMGPARPISSRFDDSMRATDAAIESDLSEMPFPDLFLGEKHLFPSAKRLKVMNRATPILLHDVSSFANVFDQDINILSEEQASGKILSLTLSHLNSITPDESPSQGGLRFRGYQSARWSYKFEELKSFHQKHGHCQVDWKANKPLLFQWIKRQRYQYKLKQDGRHSTMTGDRIAALEEVGFSWDSHRAAWEEKFNELVLFKAERGHCNVSSTFPENPQLSIWVKGQRRQLKLSRSGKIAAINVERIAKLNDLGFCWSLRDAKYKDNH